MAALGRPCRRKAQVRSFGINKSQLQTWPDSKRYLTVAYARLATSVHSRKRIKCRRGRGAKTASRCMNSSGDLTSYVVPSRLGVLFST
jgi:hypothetical protein